MSQYQEIPTNFQKGLTTSSEESVLIDGQLADLVNLLPEQTGGLRVRGGWRAGVDTGATAYAPYQHRGFGILSEQALPQLQNEWERVGNTHSSTTAITVSGMAPTAGNILIIIAESDGGVGTVGINTPSGYSLIGTVQAVGSRDARAVFGKVATGSETSVSVTITATSTTSSSVRVMEWTNLSLSSFIENKQSTTGPLLVTSSASTNTTFGVAFYTVTDVADDDVPTAGGSAVKVGATSTRTAQSASVLYYETYVTKAVISETFDTVPFGGLQLHAYTTAIDAINTSDFTQSLVVALPGDDVDTSVDTATFANATTFSSTSDATTYTVATTVAPSLNALAVLFVYHRKAGGTPDPISSVTGTNGWNVTWTVQPGALTSGEYMMSVVTAQVDSTSAGNVVVNYGTGNTQTAIRADLTVITATANNYISDFSVIGAPIRAVNTASGTATSVAISATGGWQPNEIGLAAVGLATSTTDETTPTSPWTQLTETANADSLNLSTHQANDPADVTFALDASYAYITATVMISTGINNNGYRLLKIPTDEISSGTWEVLDEDPAHTDNTQGVRIKEGAGALVYTGIGMRFPRIYDKATGVWTDVDDLGEGARSLEYHKNRFFYGGTLTHPGRLYFSDLGAGGSVPASNFIDIDADDGTAIEDLISVENLLLVVKTNSLWIVSGSGIASFFVTELAGGGGHPGESAVSTPYGTIVADTYTVWVVQGGGIDPISRPIQGDYAITGKVSTAYAFDKAYISDSDSNDVWVCNLVSGAWHRERLDDMDEGIFMVHSYNDQLFFGTRNASICGPLAYRNVGVPERIPDFSPHETTYSWRGPISMLQGPQFKYTPRHIFMQVRRHGGIKAMDVTVRAGGIAGTRELNTEITSGIEVSRERLDVGFAAGMSWLQVEATQTCSPGELPYEIERLTLGADTETTR